MALAKTGSDFTLQVPLIFAAEGGKNNSTKDLALRDATNKAAFERLGFHTNKGFTYATFAAAAPTLAQQGMINSTATREVDRLFDRMPEGAWMIAYKTLFWDVVYGDYLPQGIADMVVRFAWGSGPYTAVRTLQRVMNDSFGTDVSVDGVMGPQTAEAVNSIPNQADLIDMYRLAWENYLNNILLNNPEQNFWKKGWFDTVAAVTDFAKKKFMKLLVKPTATPKAPKAS